MIGIGENRKKFVTKFTIACDRNKNVYDVQVNSGNVHDVHTVMPFIDNMTENAKFKSIDVVADKGFILRQEIVNIL